MQLQLAVLGIADLVGDPDPERLAALAARGQVVALGDHHVAAVPAAPVEIAPGSRALAHRRHHLQELVAHREEGVLEPVLAHARIAMADLEAEHRAQLVDDLRQVAGHQADLAHAE